MHPNRSRISTLLSNLLALSIVAIVLGGIGTCVFRSITPFSTTPYNRANDIKIVKTSVARENVGGASVHYVYCTIRNTGSQLITAANLTAIFYDRSKRVVGTGVGTGLNIPAGASRLVTIMAMDVYNANSYEVQIDLAL